MAAPVTEKGQRAKLEIIKTAADLIQTRGVTETRVADVLEACVMGKSQFYHYFEDKDELLREIVDYQMENHYRGLFLNPLARVNTLTGLRRWMRDFGRMVVDEKYAKGCPAGTISMQLATDEHDLNPEIIRIMDALHEGITAALDRIHSKGRLAPGVDPAATATYILGVLQGGLTLSRIYRDPTKLQTVLKQAERMIGQLAP